MEAQIQVFGANTRNLNKVNVAIAKHSLLFTQVWAVLGSLFIINLKGQD